MVLVPTPTEFASLEPTQSKLTVVAEAFEAPHNRKRPAIRQTKEDFRTVLSPR
jgi:hypothetical protein